jgi:hypothetical protein
MSDYSADVAGAYGDLADAGAAITFTRSASTYNGLTGGTSVVTSTAAGVAIALRPTGSDVERLKALDIIPTTAAIYLVAAQGLAFAPAPQDVVAFAGVSATVRDVSALNVNGTQPILYRVVAVR